MKKLLLSLVTIMLAISYIKTNALAFNPVTDILQNTTFPIGQVASAGTAINLKNGNTSTSFLAEVADYRGMFVASFGGTRINKSDADFTDTVKIGFELNWIISKFTNPLPPNAYFLRNINLGPSYAFSAISHPGQGYPFFDINYTFK